MVTNAKNDNTTYEEESAKLQETLDHTRAILRRYKSRLDDPSQVIDLAKRKELVEDIAEMQADVQEMLDACHLLV